MGKGNFGKLTRSMRSNITSFLSQSASEIGCHPGMEIIIMTGRTASGSEITFMTPNLHVRIGELGAELVARSRLLAEDTCLEIVQKVADLAKVPCNLSAKAEELGISLPGLEEVFKTGHDLDRRVNYLSTIQGSPQGVLELIQKEISIGMGLLSEYAFLLYGWRPKPDMDHSPAEWKVTDQKFYELVAELHFLAMNIHRINNIQVSSVHPSVLGELLSGAMGQLMSAGRLIQEFGILAGVLHPKCFVLPGGSEDDSEVIEYLFASQDHLTSTEMVCFVLGNGSSRSVAVSKLDKQAPDWRSKIVFTK